MIVAATVTVTFMSLKLVDQGVRVVSAVLLLHEHWLRSEFLIGITWMGGSYVYDSQTS
jgi:hypothetical protein